MGKIVKFCAKCEEGFAEKFGFCPNCGENLQAFEMNPLEQETAQMPPTPEILAAETVMPEALPPTAETAAFSDAEVIELDSADVPEEKSYEAQPASDAASPTYFSDGEIDDYDDYRPTVIEEKDVQLRNGLLITFSCLIVSATMIAWVVSLFVHALPVGALEDQELFAYVGAIEEKPFETEEEKKKKDDEGGGGGGGGKERDRDVNRGDLANQSRTPNPYLSPMEQRDFDLKQVNTTLGPQTNRVLTQPTGIPNSLLGDLSSGRGRGEGMGNGDGKGLGGGDGDGEGPGSGGGRGGGSGGGVGGGDGDGEGPSLKPKPVGVTAGVKILSKTQAKYTDAARQNNVQGTVTLKVVFTANGTIGAISPISSLPYGLTDQAIAAARLIRFEPAKKNGQAITTSKTIVYSFTIY